MIMKSSVRSRTINNIPVKQLLIVSTGLAFLVQISVITYNYSTGFIPVFEPVNFLLRLTYGTFLSSFVALILLYSDSRLSRFLNTRLEWGNRNLARIFVQLPLVLLIGAVLGIFITWVANSIDPYETGFFNVLVVNALITAVANLILTILLEAWLFFRDGRLAARRAEELKQELFGIKFEVLKNQLNPHFLFNSLNVLSGLVNKDVRKAQDFIDEFAYVYRYVLDTIDKPIVTLRDEMKFVRSYIYLQKIRHGESLQFEIRIPDEILGQWLPPLCLQLLLENALKHNRADINTPLKIELFYEGNRLIIKNNIQRKVSEGKSTGIGLKNLKKRYELITDQLPDFMEHANEYTARIPLIENE